MTLDELLQALQELLRDGTGVESLALSSTVRVDLYGEDGTLKDSQTGTDY